MKRLWVLALAACGGSSELTTPPRDLPPRERAVAQLVELATLPELDTMSVARVLETTPGRSSCAEFRCDSTLAPTELFTGIQVTSGRGWRTVRLVPTASLGLALQDLEPAVLDARYSSEPQIIHHTASFDIGAIIHHFAFGTQELAVTIPVEPAARTLREAAIESGIDQVNVAGRRDAIRTIDVARPSGVSPGAPTLREFRRWSQAL